MHNLAFVLQTVSLSGFIIFAALALLQHIRDEDKITKSKRAFARIDLALRRTSSHPGNRVKQVKAIIEEAQS